MHGVSVLFFGCGLETAPPWDAWGLGVILWVRPRPHLLAFVCVLGGWLVGIEVLEEFLKLVKVGDKYISSFGTFVWTYYACGFELVGKFACAVVSYLEGAL